MDIAIGVQFSSRELQLEVDASPKELRRALEEALAEGRKVLWLTDRHGREVGVPVDKLAYIELGTERTGKRVGFAVGPAEKP